MHEQQLVPALESAGPARRANARRQTFGKVQVVEGDHGGEKKPVKLPALDNSTAIARQD
jgi:hypothetical protein